LFRVIAAVLIFITAGSVTALPLSSLPHGIKKVCMKKNSMSNREEMLFNEGWNFSRYGAMPDGSTSVEPQGLEQTGVDASGWRTVDLPHDWGIEGPFRPELPGATGKLPWAGIGWYRKTFHIPEQDRGRRIFIDFDGAMSHSKVWLNGEYIGGWPYGYSSFRLELTNHLNFGRENVLAVRLENPPEFSRWYPGGGLYRNVRLVKTAPVHVAHWGTSITVPEVSEKSAVIRISATIENQSAAAADITVRHEIFEKGSVPVKVAETSVCEGSVLPGEKRFFESTVVLTDFKRWDVNSPELYFVQTTVFQNGNPVDTCQTVFGIRTIEFIADRGFLLNGRVLQIKGVCLHHDLGPLGAAVNTRAIERQLEIMQEMGCNAIRTSHNPPAPELLDLCDRMGMLVQVEAFDCWAIGKNDHDYSVLFDEWHDRDLTAMIHRDRNHPSVFMWSTGNEVMEQWPDRQVNPELSRRLRDIVHREDPTRPVSVGCNTAASGFNGFEQTVDVFGYNYNPKLYRKFREAHPEIPLYGSETSSCISSRGEYFFPVLDDMGKGAGGYFQVSSYDLYAHPWATTPETQFEMLDRNPEVAGEFVWTGFDYIGEPTPYNKDKTNLLNFSDPEDRDKMAKELELLGDHIPPRSSYFGIVDLCGFKKDRFYLYQTRWLPELPVAHILPHWNWPERIGQVTPVHVYTSGDEAELFLNGNSLGRRTKGLYQYRMRWDDVIYASGELKVVAFRNGQKWAEETVETTGPAAKLKLSADRQTICADGQDLSFVTVIIEDSNGRMVPRSDNTVKFSITGPGEILAVDSGNPVSHEPFQGKEHKAFNGLCLAVIRSLGGQPGNVTLTALSEGLQPAEVEVLSK
jgi:beta-galactosidase